LTFLGITAVEDALQWNASETIKRLKDSGLKIWIATGDKYETTLGVVKACKLINASQVDNMAVLISEDVNVLRLGFEDAFSRLETQSNLELLVLSGVSLTVIEADDELVGYMLQLIAVASSTIFVRMSPSQKV